jgi:hypothetical protein
MEAVREVLARYLPNHTWRSRPKINAVQGAERFGRLNVWSATRKLPRGRIVGLSDKWRPEVP